MQNLSVFVAAVGVSFVLTAPARAQQFNGATSFPDGTGFYSEAIECVDVDHDGDLDIFVADGNGFVSGAAQQNKLYINKFIETGTPWVIADESVLRLGANTSCAKGVATGDVNGDGWADVMFTNTAAAGAIPSLYINQGVANPGFFTLESAARGFTTAFKAGAASFADTDDDGDLDVIINDAFNTSPAARLHLYVNNGAGVFTENLATFPSPTRTVQMDVQTADMDNDWDIDVLGFTKMGVAGGSHILLLGNGAGTFTDSSSLITPASGNTYEADVADMDGDTDLDMFFVSMSGFAEGCVRNNLIGLGTFTFTNGAPLGGTDDNEIAFLDYDNDADYDVLIGALGGPERMYRNDGGLSFVLAAGTIQAVTDSTLDNSVADLNNDGKYDILSANGESGSFINRFYRNTGSADTLPPVITATNAPVSVLSGTPVVVKAKIRDQTLDDGVNYVTPSADYVITTSPLSDLMQITAGGFSPSSLIVAAGTNVTFQNVSGVAQDVTSTSAPYTYYSGVIPDSTSYARTFVRPGTYNITSVLGGFNATITVTGTANSALALHMGGQMYRFRMNDTAGGLGTQLCYELRFRDWPGNTRVSEPGCVTLTIPSVGTGECFGDTVAACPCSAAGGSLVPNAGAAGNGCANSTFPAGAHLSATGNAVDNAGDTLVLTCTNMPGPGMFIQANALGGPFVNFNDGILCAAVGIIRLGVVFPTAGVASYPGGLTPNPIHVAGFPVLAGGSPTPETKHYQCWYRDITVGFCNVAGHNMSNGLAIVWAP